MRQGRWLVASAGAVAGLAALTFARTLGGSFIWDDHLHIVGNARLVGLAGLAEIWSALWEESCSLLRL
jgi:hypothetical protein